MSPGMEVDKPREVKQPSSAYRIMRIVEIDPRETYLYVKGAGEFSVQSALDEFKKVVEACSQYQRFRVLADMREVSTDNNVLSLYEVGVQMPKYWKGISCLALLNDPEQILPDKFWQNVTRNQGLNTGVFDNLPEAVAWLEKHCH